MLRFASKPDKVLNEIVSNALDMVILELEDDMDLNWENEFIYNFFEVEFVKSFGGIPDGMPIILNELKKIKKAHLSSDIYMPTDIHFKMLDRILKVYCDLYNDEFHLHEDSAIKCNGEILQRLSYNSILDIFFWDTDYDLDEEIASELLNNRQLREHIDSSISIQALNTAAGKPIDSIDLKLEKWEKPDWDDDVDLSEFWLDEDDL